MEWLTAILAFATTMLIFSIITTTLVETIHRLLGSRSFGLIKMLEHMYDRVIDPHMNAGQEADPGEAVREARRKAFVERMILVRAPAWPFVETAGASSQNASPSTGNGYVRKVLGYIRQLWYRYNGASRLARDLGVGQERLLSHLPVVTFMERLGTSAFAKTWKDTYDSDPELGERVLQDIGQKFELFGQDASTYFERKARKFAVAMAMIVAWTFYVHPYDLIQTYLQRPEVAAKVAALSEEFLERVPEVERIVAVPTELPANNGADGQDGEADVNDGGQQVEDAEGGDDEAQQAGPAVDQEDKTSEPEDDVEPSPEQVLAATLQSIKADLETLQATEAPVGWTAEKGRCLPKEEGAFCWFYIPNNITDFIWLLLGGLLVGLGAPFWARAVRQIAEVRDAPKDVAKLLKSETQVQTVQGQQTTPTASGRSEAIEAFHVAVAGQVTPTSENQAPPAEEASP